MKIRIALAGNPNSGKTTLFNGLTGSNQFVGNWPGVTVEKKTGFLKGRKDVEIIDLPGVYSLSPYTLEERVAKKFLLEEKPDVILNIIDGTNLERNLYLTTQLLELKIPVVVAVNMMDIIEKKGDKLDLKLLSHELECKTIAISAIKGDGILEAAELAIDEANGFLKKGEFKGYSRILHTCINMEENEEECIGKRYEYISKVISEVYTYKEREEDSVSEKIDRVLTHKWLGLPIFVAIMFLIYFISITTVGSFLTDWTKDVLFGKIITNGATSFLESVNAESWLIGLVVDGIIAGVGAVIGFVPQMLVLFFFLAFLEGSGYMARIAFILDKIFARFGLSGKSFIPMLIGTGCGVPGIMASRTIEDQNDRRMTIMTTTFIPCSAKLPMIALIAASIFDGAWWVAPSGYFLGIGAVLVSGLFLKSTKLFAGDGSPFIMELPNYHMPTLTNLFRSMWERGWSFIKKAGTIILLSTIVIWFLSNFGFVDGEFVMTGDMSKGLLATLGTYIAVIFKPLGFGTWQATVATLMGLIAKENIVGSLGVLYGVGGLGLHFTPLAAYSFMAFNLLCAPCFAAIGAIKKEMNSIKWTLFAVGYQTGFAYLVALIINNIGKGFLLGIIVLLIIRKIYKDKKNGKGCSGNCSSCQGCSSCFNNSGTKETLQKEAV